MQCAANTTTNNDDDSSKQQPQAVHRPADWLSPRASFSFTLDWWSSSSAAERATVTPSPRPGFRSVVFVALRNAPSDDATRTTFFVDRASIGSVT
jgi:hypothetical protein